jgi:hypothetical protein
MSVWNYGVGICKNAEEFPRFAGRYDNGAVSQLDDFIHCKPGGLGHTLIRTPSLSVWIM